MPIYEYECQKCHELFELFQGINAPTVTVCSLCSGTAVRLISRPAILFKGSGFHVTDYSKSGKNLDTPSQKTEENGKPNESNKPSEISKKEEKPAP